MSFRRFIRLQKHFDSAKFCNLLQHIMINILYVVMRTSCIVVILVHIVIHYLYEITVVL